MRFLIKSYIQTKEVSEPIVGQTDTLGQAHFFIRNHPKLFIIVFMRFATWNGMINALKTNFRLEVRNTIFVRMPFLNRSIFFEKIVFLLENVQRTFS